MVVLLEVEESSDLQFVSGAQKVRLGRVGGLLLCVCMACFLPLVLVLYNSYITVALDTLLYV